MGIRNGVLEEEKSIEKENVGADGFPPGCHDKKAQYGCQLEEKTTELRKIKASQAKRTAQEEITKKLRLWERKQEECA